VEGSDGEVGLRMEAQRADWLEKVEKERTVESTMSVAVGRVRASHYVAVLANAHQGSL
jgi:hypothetical protein